jgi:hypothetical protein
MTSMNWNQDVKKFADLLYKNGTDTSNTTVAAIASPGIGKKLAIYWMKLNVKTADDVTTKSGTTTKDTNYLGDTGGCVIDYGNSPLVLGQDEGLNFGKTGATNFSWAVQYEVLNA